MGGPTFERSPTLAEFEGPCRRLPDPSDSSWVWIVAEAPLTGRRRIFVQDTIISRQSILSRWADLSTRGFRQSPMPNERLLVNLDRHRKGLVDIYAGGANILGPLVGLDVAEV